MRALTNALLVSLALVAPFVAAHKEPKTAEEIEVQRALQAAAYHCAPAVERFTAARKRSWARKVLAGRPELPGYQELFNAGTYEDEPGTLPASENDDQTIMSCTPVSTTKMQNNTCVLVPEVTEGPYYHEAGHFIRQNIAEEQDGLLLLLDIGVIDVNTCKPMPNVLVDIWQSNATGYYAGHPVPKPEHIGVKSQVGGKRSGLLPPYPMTVPEETWLRGAWPTDENGVAQFTTIFPGYYNGRATHIHTKVFPEWTPHENGTFSGKRLVHIGQFFFEDEMNLVVDKMHPYTENPLKEGLGRTRNWRDSLNIFEDSRGPEGKYNPVFKTHLLGAVVGQGLIGYITMGVDGNADRSNQWEGVKN